jgi:hypothetical protein
MDPQNNNFVTYLILPDGGKVKFKPHNTTVTDGFYKYTATAVIDPHGLQTTLTWGTSAMGGNATEGNRTAGRYLQFTYAATDSSRISQVQEFINNVGRRSVQYYYYYTVWLDHVVYYGNPNWTAHYQYVAANAGGPDLPPLLQTCDDPMYPGSMKRIGYVYRTANNPDGTTPAYGQIQSENYYDGTAVGAAVSTLAVGTDGVHTGSAYRKEMRGDGVIRGLFTTRRCGPFHGPPIHHRLRFTTSLLTLRQLPRIQTDYTTNTLTDTPCHVSTHPGMLNQTQHAADLRRAVALTQTIGTLITRITSTASPTKEAIPLHSCVTPTIGLPGLIIQMADWRRFPTTRLTFTRSAPIA